MKIVRRVEEKESYSVDTVAGEGMKKVHSKTFRHSVMKVKTSLNRIKNRARKAMEVKKWMVRRMKRSVSVKTKLQEEIVEWMLKLLRMKKQWALIVNFQNLKLKCDKLNVNKRRSLLTDALYNVTHLCLNISM